MNIREQIIDYLNRNRVSTTEVTDCLEKAGVVEGIMPITRGKYIAGNVEWIYAINESNWTIHEQIADMEENKIVFVSVINCKNRAVFGELVSKYICLYKQSKGIVVDGKMRDAAGLIRQNYPIWCKGFTPVGCFNKPVEDIDNDMIQIERNKYINSIAVCDDCGVVIIPSSCINKEFLNKLKQIENQEDIWFDRLDHFKENTFQIVCQKEYLRDEDYMNKMKMD